MDGYRHNLQEVKALARGRWLEILPALDVRFTAAASRPGVHVPCPVHGGTDGFRLLPRNSDDGGGRCNTCGYFPDGFELLRWAAGWSLPWTIQQVGQYLRGAAYDSARPAPAPAPAPGAAENADTIAARQRAINSQLKGCNQTPHEAARLYFERRGIPGAADLRSPSLLYHAGLPYYVKGKPLLNGRGGWLTFPAIVGRVSSASGWMGLQKIYLTKDGNKATGTIREAMQAAGLPDQDANCKQMLSAAGMIGGAVRLGKAGRVLAVGEGLETMVVNIPDQVERLVIFADKDRNGAGMAAASALAAREEARRDVKILLPNADILEGEKGIDWLDAVVAGNSVQIKSFMG